MYNILTERLIRMDKSDGSRVEASLPAVYAALMADEVEAFPALRPHQRHSWHAFLVQLGAMAMHKAGMTEPPADPDIWTDLIRALTADFPDDEPWQLVVNDITKPAFIQPPASFEDKLAEYKDGIETPDELDMLVMAKNHDVKRFSAGLGQIDDWIYSLITLQTMDGNPGRNPGIARMNGAYGNRPAFSLTPSTRFGAHVRRDIMVLLELYEDLLDNFPMQDGGAQLLWMQPWDGTKPEALLLKQLDPLYIEVCRRIRFRVSADGKLSAVKATAKEARIEAKALNGVTGDPWTPVDRSNGKSLTLAAGGFTYKRTVEYLVGGWDRPILCKLTDEEIRSSDTMHLVARGMVRGQGKTEGYYERTIPIRKKLGSAMMRQGPGTDDLGRIANDRIEDVGKVQRILSHAIQVFLARGETDKISPEHRNLARLWLNRLDETVDARFFEHLQEEFEADDRDERQHIRNNWQRDVVDHAREFLDDAMDSLPCPEIERYKARVRAEGLFEGRIRGNKGLPSLFTEKGDDDDH